MTILSHVPYRWHRSSGTHLLVDLLRKKLITHFPHVCVLTANSCLEKVPIRFAITNFSTNEDRYNRSSPLNYTQTLELMAGFDNVRSLQWSIMSAVVVKA